MKRSSLAILFGAALLAGPAMAQSSVKDDPAPGAASLLGANFAKAEREIREAAVSRDDPARSINLGIALAMSGDKEKAAKEFNRALSADDVQVVVADGSTTSSHEIATRALTALERGELGR